MARQARIETTTCPYTGMPMRRSREWTDMELDEGYRATVFLLGDRIIVGRPFGYVTLQGVKNILETSRQIIDEHLDPDRPYVHIQDYTYITGVNLKARKYFSDEMKKRLRTRAIVFCGQTPFGRIAFQLAARLHNFPCEMIITKDYPEAALTARRVILQDSPDPSDAPAQSPAGTERSDNWQVEAEGFTANFEVLEGSIIHARLSGNLEEEHAAELGKVRARVLAAIDNDLPLFFLSGLSGLRGASRKARKAMEQQFFTLNGKRPVSGIFVYGANALIRPAIRLGEFFSGVKVSLHGDFASAMAALREEQSRAAGIIADHTDRRLAGEDRVASLTRRHVDEVLSYLSNLNWDRAGTARRTEVRADHPFLPVFEALDLIKMDLDGLFREHRETVEELVKTRDGLWNRVAERTADLSSANDRLRQTDLARRRQAAELNAALGRIFTDLSGELSRIEAESTTEEGARSAERIRSSLAAAEKVVGRFCREGLVYEPDAAGAAPYSRPASDEKGERP